MNEQRNYILAILLVVLILFGWPYVQEKYFPNAQQTGAEIAQKNDAAVPASADSASPAPTAAGTVALPDAQEQVIKLDDALSGSPRIAVETPKLKGSLSLKGARIDDMVLTQHDVALKGDEPVRLLSPSGTEKSYFAEFGWEGVNVKTPGKDTLWTANAAKLSPQSPVKLSWDNDEGLLFEIALSIDENYMITADRSVRNSSAAPVALTSYALVSRKGKSVDPSTFTIHVGPMGVFGDDVNYDWDYDEVTEAMGEKAAADRPEFQNADWLGFTDHYWLTAIVPDAKDNQNGYFLHSAKGDVFNVRTQDSQSRLIQPGKQISENVRFFVGAKEVKLLDAYQNKLGINKFSMAIDWGWFRPIEQFFFNILDWFFKLTGNFGLAIIGLTICVRLVLFPIANKQFASMAQMRAIQPKQKEIQEKYKDDKQRQQQEIMKLYKEEKVNPLAGCLPIFLQIPVFFSLYKLLMLSIDMRHQPFALWIHDLSAPDPMSPVNLFGLLPFTPPSFLAIGILPILVGLTMWLQQRLNPTPPDPVQAQVFALMPWFLMFVMAPFAAGLQLYWATNNILSILQQRLLYARHPQMKEAMKKDNAERKAKAAEKKAAK